MPTVVNYYIPVYAEVSNDETQIVRPTEQQATDEVINICCLNVTKPEHYKETKCLLGCSFFKFKKV